MEAGYSAAGAPKALGRVHGRGGTRGGAVAPVSSFKHPAEPIYFVQLGRAGGNRELPLDSHTRSGRSFTLTQVEAGSLAQ